MNDKLDELASGIDDAVTSAEELQDEPGAIPDKKIDKVRDALDKAQEAVAELEDAEDSHDVHST